MSPDEPRAGEDGGEPLGSVGEEAAKLFTALQDWARESAAGEEHAHAAEPGAECAWCPICRARALLRQTSPEVKGHLAVAASSFLQAAAGLFAPARPPGAPDPGVQKIDLDDLSGDDSEWDAD